MWTVGGAKDKPTTVYHCVSGFSHSSYSYVWCDKSYTVEPQARGSFSLIMEPSNSSSKQHHSMCPLPYKAYMAAMHPPTAHTYIKIKVPLHCTWMETPINLDTNFVNMFIYANHRNHSSSWKFRSLISSTTIQSHPEPAQVLGMYTMSYVTHNNITAILGSIYKHTVIRKPGR